MSRYYVVVPRSQDDEWSDMIDFDANDSREFSSEEYRELRFSSGVYDEFDKKFETIIDDCEEDEIGRNDIKKAIKIVKDYLDKNASSQACKKLLKCLEDAADRGVGVCFINLP